MYFLKIIIFLIKNSFLFVFLMPMANLNLNLKIFKDFNLKSYFFLLEK